MNKIKTFLIQNSIAPYRIPLFSLLANDPDIEFSVLRLTRTESHRKEWESIQNFPFPVRTVKGFSFSRNYEEHVRFNPGLGLILFKEKPNVIIIGGFSYASVISVMLKKKIDSKIILWFEGTCYTEHSVSKFRHSLRKYIIHRADAVITASELSEQYIRSQLSTSDNQAFFMAYNNIDNRYFDNSVQKFKANSRLFNDLKGKYGAKVILFTGQLIKRKGVFELLQGFEIIQRSNHHVSLLLVGNGPLENELKAYCKQHGLSRVFFEGFIRQEDLPNYYAIADMFVLLSHWDCNPLVIFEALASGLPIVASYRVGNVPEFVKDNYNGFVVDPFNTDQVADRIVKILNDPGLQRKFSKNSKRLSEKSNYEDSYRTFKKAIFHVLGYDS